MKSISAPIQPLWKMQNAWLLKHAPHLSIQKWVLLDHYVPLSFVSLLALWTWWANFTGASRKCWFAAWYIIAIIPIIHFIQHVKRLIIWRISEKCYLKNRGATYFCHAFSLVVTLFLHLQAKRKVPYFCSGDFGKCMDIFLDLLATKDTGIRNGIANFKHVYNSQRL